MAWFYICLSLVIFSCVLAQAPPLIPSAFYGKFTEYNAPLSTPPPYVNGIPEAPFIATRGEVYYDWSMRSMIENRLDYCVNIFPNGNNFTCVFHNTQETSFLITGPGSPFPPCCVFGKPWFPPPPNFLTSKVKATFDSFKPWSNFNATWFIVPEIEPPTGPFYYAFENESSPQLYLSFSFPGINGWVQQNFFNITYEAPNSNVFDIPTVCNKGNVPSCGIDPN